MGTSLPFLANDSTRWCIRLLGEFRVEKGERRATFRTQKTASLLAYLAFYQGKLVSKEALADMFWPESEPSLARQSLRMALSDIRSSLRCPDWDPDHYLLSDRNTIEVREDTFWTDVRTMQSALASAQGDTNLIRSAIGLYSGRFLPHSSEQWVYPQALEIEEQYAQAVCSLIPNLARNSELTEAVHIGRHAIALCAPREDLHGALIKCYAESGQVAAAVRQYEELETILDDLWGERPSEATTRLLSELPKSDSEELPMSRALISQDYSPSDATQFVGRETELEHLESALGPSSLGPRLWTVVGIGGTGKTRLVMRLAEAMSKAYDGRVYFLSLASAQSTHQMWDSLGSLAASQSQDESAILDALIARIGSKPTLIVLDNVEQLVEPVGALLNTLLERCQPLKVITTSRIPLGSASERLLRLPPLALPIPGCSIEELRRSPAVQLLTDAAQASRQGFAVTPNNAEGVRLLCHFLEGLPLALVLAATRLGTQTPTQVAASLSRRADLGAPTMGSRVRHQSLESVVQWSLDQLSEYERAAFLKLAYCRGDFEASLASSVLGPDALPLVETFSRHALLTWEETAESLRYRMLETIREVASEGLESDPDLYRAALHGHTNWVVAFADSKPEASRIVAEASHLLTVLEAGAESLLPAELCWKVAAMAQAAIAHTGRAYLWLDALERLLSTTQDSLSPAFATTAFGITADAQYAVRNIQRSYFLLNCAIESAESSGNTELRIATLLKLRIPATLLGEYDRAKAGLEQAYKLAEGNSAYAEVATGLGWLELCRNNPPRAAEYFGTASQSMTELSESVRAELLMGQATALACMGDPHAEVVFAESDRTLALANTPDLSARQRWLRAWVRLKSERLQEAESDIMEGLRIYQENGITLGQTPLTIAGVILAATGQRQAALSAWARAENARRIHSMSLLPMLEPDYLAALERNATSPGSLEWSNALKLESTRGDLEFLEEAFSKHA